jgi:AcrR family transcriptional regulator
MKESSNPSSIRSKKMITDAFLELLQTIPYHKITITDITAKALLVRATFYRNFNSKEEILNYYIDELYKNFVALLSRNSALNNYMIAKTYFEFWEQHKEFLVLLNENNLMINILKKYDEYLPQINALFPCSNKEDLKTVSFKYRTAFNSGGFWKILCLWVDNRFHPPAKTLAEMFQTFSS